MTGPSGGGTNGNDRDGDDPDSDDSILASQTERDISKYR